MKVLEVNFFLKHSVDVKLVKHYAKKILSRFLIIRRICGFYRATRDIDIATLSVRPSVRLSVRP